MTTPGFTAAKSLRRTRRLGVAARSETATGGVAPAGPIYQWGDVIICCDPCGTAADGSVFNCCHECGTATGATSSNRLVLLSR
jgi:hypothetical protein